MEAFELGETAARILMPIIAGVIGFYIGIRIYNKRKRGEG